MWVKVPVRRADRDGFGQELGPGNRDISDQIPTPNSVAESGSECCSFLGLHAVGRALCLVGFHKAIGSGLGAPLAADLGLRRFYATSCHI